MNKMTVTHRLSVSPEGPREVRNKDLVHLRQGDLDGACGPYFLISGLITLRLLRRKRVMNMKSWDGRTREGRFRDALANFGSLSCNGTTSEDLVWLTGIDKTKKLGAHSFTGSKTHIVESIAVAIDQDCLAIVGVHWAGDAGHWMLVVGYQGVEQSGKTQLTHLLCLDPAQEAPKTCLWNAVIDVFRHDGSSTNVGKLASLHWGMNGATSKCHIDSAILLKTR